MSIVIGFDPSLSHFGYAVAQVSPAPFFDVHFVETGVWSTKPLGDDATKTQGYARRCEGLARSLFGLLERFGRPSVIACEGVAMPFGKTSMQTVGALGRVRGLIDALAASQNLTVQEYSPAHLKRLITGAKDGSKQQVRDLMEATYPELCTLWPSRASDIEHAADACAALHAALTQSHP